MFRLRVHIATRRPLSTNDQMGVDNEHVVLVDIKFS
jgi:hypothetical protein